MEKEQTAYKAHVLILPFPAQGHISPMLEFSKRLASKGIKATLINTKYINKSMHSDPTSQIAVETISDGFDDGGVSQADQKSDVYLSTFKVVGSQSLENLIKKLDDSRLPVNALIYDGHLTWALDVAKKFGLMGVVFFTQSCAVNSIYFHVQRGLLPLPLSGPSVLLPGMPMLEVSDAPSFIGNFGSYPTFYELVVNQFTNVDEADWVLCNSFYNLEKEVVDWMAKRWRVLTVGPTVPSSMLLDKRSEDDKNYGISLFEPKTSACMNWLHAKRSDSVVYVSFGSLAQLGEEQMEELAWGLKGTDCYFLWVVRESEKSKLPKTFLEETSEKGLVVTWCPQLDVLEHESIGCFVTHCGFNSVLEALTTGVPVVAMPQWTDQPTNAKYVEDVWKIGIRARPDEKGIVRREMAELCIKEVMEGERRKEIMENAKKWQNAAIEAIDEGGTSNRNMCEFAAALIEHGR